MRYPEEYEQDHSFNDTDINLDEDAETLSHQREVRRKLEEKLEQKRLKQEMDDYDDEFEWDD